MDSWRHSAYFITVTNEITERTQKLGGRIKEVRNPIKGLHFRETLCGNCICESRCQVTMSFNHACHGCS